MRFRLILCLSLTACGSDGGGSTAVKPSVSTVVVTPSNASLTVGGATTFAATARDHAGNTVAGRPVTWTAQNTAVATVTSSGTTTAVGPGTSLVTATVDGVSGSASITVAAPAVSRIVLTPAPMLVAVGATFSLHADALDQANNKIQGQSFTYQSSAPSIAMVDANGVVTGVSGGQATITATAAGIGGTSQALVLAPTMLGGRLVTTDSGPTQSLQFALQTGAGASLQSFPTLVDASGVFRLNAPLPLVTTDSVSFVVDVAGGSRVYHPIVWSTSSVNALASALRPLLVPKRVSFGTPVYPTSTMDVSLQDAFARVCTDDTNANCNSFFPRDWKSAVILWSDADLPVPLAFNRGTGAISAADSVALWSVIDRMQKELGRQLFVPTDFSRVVAPDVNGFSRKAVLVSIDPALSGFAGYTNWIWDFDGNMLAAKTRVRVNSSLASSSLMTHELLHALGFHHTCAWPTVMGGYGCASAAGATQSDAAAFTLANQIRRAIVANSPTTGLGDALRGEQLRELGITAARTADLPIPFASVLSRQVFFGGKLVFANGAP